MKFWEIVHYSFWTLQYIVPARALSAFFRAVRAHNSRTRDAAAKHAAIAFTGAATPIVYLAMNGLLCLAFSTDPSYECATRVYVNCSEIMAMVANSAVFVVVHFQPVTLVQVTHLEIPRYQMLGILFNGILLLLALTMHSQSERFQPLTKNLVVISSLVNPCMMLMLTAFAYSIISERRRAKMMSSTVHGSLPRHVRTEPGCWGKVRQHGLFSSYHDVAHCQHRGLHDYLYTGLRSMAGRHS